MFDASTQRRINSAAYKATRRHVYVGIAASRVALTRNINVARRASLYSVDKRCAHAAYHVVEIRHRAIKRAARIAAWRQRYQRVTSDVARSMCAQRSAKRKRNISISMTVAANISSRTRQLARAWRTKRQNGSAPLAKNYIALRLKRRKRVEIKRHLSSSLSAKRMALMWHA